MNNSSSRQLTFGFRQAPALPFAVSPRRIHRAIRREIGTAPVKFGVFGYLEDVATLRQLRKQYRVELRRAGGAAAFATTPRGRRAHRLFESLSSRIVTEHESLCG